MLIPFLIFAWITSGLIYLFVAEQGPFNFLSPSSLIFLIEEIKLFFILIILPLILPRPYGRPFKGRYSKGIIRGLTNFGLLILLFLPLTIIGAILSDAKPSSLIIEHLLLIFIWLIILLIKQNTLRWYYLVIFTLSGALPLFYYLMAELYGRILTGLLYFNPFWLLYKILEK